MAAGEARVSAATAAQRRVLIRVLQWERGGGERGRPASASRPLLQDRPVPRTGLADASEVLGTHLEHAGPVRRPDLPDRGVVEAAHLADHRVVMTAGLQHRRTVGIAALDDGEVVGRPRLSDVGVADAAVLDNHAGVAGERLAGKRKGRGDGCEQKHSKGYGEPPSDAWLIRDVSEAGLPGRA